MATLFFRKKMNKSDSDLNFDAYKINYVGYETQTHSVRFVVLVQ